MANNVNVNEKLLIDGSPGKPGDVIQSRGNKTPAWTPISALISKISKDKKPKAFEEKDARAGKTGAEKTKKDGRPGLVGAAKEEVLERTKGVLSEAFPLLTTGPYKRALQSIPGVGLATSIIKRSGVFRDVSLPSFGRVFGGKKKEEGKQKQKRVDQTKKDTDILSQGSLPVMESILGEVVKIREALGGGKNKGKAAPTPGSAAESVATAPELKEGYIFEPPKGKGQGGYKKVGSGRYVKQAEAVKKPSATATAGGKAGGTGAKAAGGIARAGAAVGRGALGMALNVGRGAMGAAGAAGGLVGGLKLGAILLALSMFLPKDIKSVIGSIFEGLLEGLGFDKDTIEAIFTPFRILSDIAELIKSVLGAVWDGIKWLWKKIGEIMDWFTGRKNVSASEEASRATGGTGHGEFTTGGEGGGEATTPIPQEPAATLPPKETAGATEEKAGTRVPSASSSGSAVAPAAASPASRVPTPPPPPLPAIAAAPPPLMLPERKIEPSEKEKKLEDFLNKPENQIKKTQLEDLNNQIIRFEGEIDATKKMLGNARSSEQKKQLQAVLVQQERNLEAAQTQKTDLIDSIAKDAGVDTAAGGEPATAPPSALPSDGTVAGAGAGGEGAGAGAGAAGGEGGAAPTPSAAGSEPAPAPLEEGDTTLPPAPSQPIPMEPTTGEEIGKESMAVEAARDEPMPEMNTNFVSDGQIAAGNVSENPGSVPSPDAPREDLDTDIFFSAVA